MLAIGVFKMSNVPGSYEKTSSDVQFTQNESGSGTLTANCTKIDGSTEESTLFYDVANMNGELTALPGGSYQRTSRNIRLENGDDGGVYLVAECEKINGDWVESKLALGDIANMDGVLTRG